MTTYFYSCDGGSLLIGNKQYTICIGNGLGDGRFKVFISEDRSVPDDFDFITNVNGKFNLYSYDCLDKDELDYNILTTLKGQYGIYRNEDGEILFQKW